MIYSLSATGHPRAVQESQNPRKQVSLFTRTGKQWGKLTHPQGWLSLWAENSYKVRLELSRTFYSLPWSENFNHAIDPSLLSRKFQQRHVGFSRGSLTWPALQYREWQPLNVRPPWTLLQCTLQRYWVVIKGSFIVLSN